jgi:hypothetical protein
MAHKLHAFTGLSAPSLSCSAELERSGSFVSAVYVLKGRLDSLIAPVSRKTGGIFSRADGLWQHTCFELFLRLPAGDEYLEFNFSPAGAWNAYKFDGYRAGMRPLSDVCLQYSDWQSDGKEARLEIKLEAAELSDIKAGSMQAGLTAVLETSDQGLSYWALAHPGEKPDFHNSKGFLVRL